MRCYVIRSQDAPSYSFHRQSTYLASHINILVRIYMAECHVHAPQRIARGGGAKAWHGILAAIVVVAAQIERQQPGILMNFVHVEDVIGRRKHDSVAALLRQDQ